MSADVCDSEARIAGGCTLSCRAKLLRHDVGRPLCIASFRNLVLVLDGASPSQRLSNRMDLGQGLRQ